MRKTIPYRRTEAWLAIIVWSPDGACPIPNPPNTIIPTIIREGRARGDANLLDRARKMHDWLVSIQMPSGALRGGMMGESPVVPVTFNTGQILLGLAAGVSEFGDVYRPTMLAAADWLVRTQDGDGCWREHSTPFAAPGDKTYETHASWGLFEAARLAPDYGYAEAGCEASIGPLFRIALAGLRTVV